ncbi:hypothetical protein HYW55_05290 [Candidatus Gottesmanbacteria bacterium]|nr:hypothetical protein [Candidatus Gottesmanbacteria bacterium]
MIKKFLVGISASAVILGSMAIPAFAGNSGDGSGYGTQPGYDVSASHTECQGHGSFGYFGKNWNLGNEQSGHYPGVSYPGPGADGQATGYNNSHLCGNPQN